MSTLYLCGAGNPEGVRLAKRVASCGGGFERIVLLDDDPAKHGRSFLGVEVAGPIELLAMAPRDALVQSLVARTTRGRRAVGERIARHGLRVARLVHPAVDTEGVELAEDLVVYEHAVLGPEVALGPGSVVFMGAVVGHESRVGAGCVIASNAVLNARVVLEEGVYVGTNAAILPEVRVGAFATIGAGAVVVEDVPAGATVFGAPVEVLASSGSPTHEQPPRAAAPAMAPPSPAPRPIASAERERRMEQLVLAAWRAVLGRPVGLDERFFEAGGSSLLALRLVEHLRRATGLPLVLLDAYRFVTVRTMARHLSSCQTPMSTGAGAERDAALPSRA